MDAKSYVKWQKIADEFLNSDMDEAEFCKAKKIDVELFCRRLREVESHEEQENAGAREDNLFVELIPQGNEDSKVIASDILQVKFHGAVFELKPDFQTDVFRQALQIPTLKTIKIFFQIISRNCVSSRITIWRSKKFAR